MRHLSMSWYTERGHLVCRWIQLEDREKCGPFSVGERLRLFYNPGNRSEAAPVLANALGER